MRQVFSLFCTQLILHLQTLASIFIALGQLKKILIHLQGLVHAIVEIVQMIGLLLQIIIAQPNEQDLTDKDRQQNDWRQMIAEKDKTGNGC